MKGKDKFARLPSYLDLLGSRGGSSRHDYSKMRRAYATSRSWEPPPGHVQPPFGLADEVAAVALFQIS